MKRHPALSPLTLCIWAAWATTATPTRAEAPAPQRVEIIGVSPVPGLGVPRNQVPGNVQSARAEDIEASQALDLSSFLARRLGSVHLNEIQNNPLQPDVNYRGFTASPLLGSQQGLSVFLDGVRLNQPFGEVVSWDLLPKAAIASMSLMPGSNPLFGLNTLGGALAVQTKTGRTHPGHSLQVSGGSHGRLALEFESGGSTGAGTDSLHWFVTGHGFGEDGWRDFSKSQVGQFFGKFGFTAAGTAWTLTAALADTDLNGNGLQEQRFLARDRQSVYTHPDNTKNRAGLLNLAWDHGLAGGLTLTGNVYARSIRAMSRSLLNRGR